MRKNHWPWAFPLIALTYISISKGEWITAAIIVTLLLSTLACSLQKVNKATVCTTDLEDETGTVIPFETVVRIVRNGDNVPAVIVTANGETELKIADKDFAKLAKTNLTCWAVDGKKITASVGEESQALQISYTPQGKYSTYKNKFDFFFVYLAPVAFFLGYLYKLELLSFAAVAAGVCYWLFFKFLNVFREVELSVLGDTILLKDENLVEHRLKFGDIAAIDQGFFRVKVTAKDGRVFHFPQGFVLLPELIEELASIK